MWQLLCKDEIRATFDLETMSLGNVTEYKVKNLKVLGTLPLTCEESKFLIWLNSRHASKHRSHLTAYLSNIGCNNTKGFLELTHGISINDCYWVKKDTEDILWHQVSPYTNNYDEAIQHLAFDGLGLHGERISTTSPEFGTAGMFDKCWKRENGGIYLYKRGNDIASNSGNEPYCEVLASQVFQKLKAGIPYELVNFRNKVASKCKLFNTEDISFTPYYAVRKEGSGLIDTLQFYESINSDDTFRRIIVADALTLNTDRHDGNHGVLCNSSTNAILHAAPGYDYNLSLLPYLTRDNFAELNDLIKKYTPKIGEDFIDTAKAVLTSEIRSDLVAMKGIELTLPFYDEKFPEERAKWLTEVVNYQINNVLNDGEPVYPTLKIDGLSNQFKYRLKYKMTEDEFIKDIPRLMGVLGTTSMVEFEERIADLL